MKQQILKILKEKHLKTGGHCGVLIYNFNYNLMELKDTLNKMYSEGLITVHDGAHGKLIKIATNEN